ncbi:DUF4003 family protein [Sporosarcina pasteurii]|nr:DUF4003 family protein [Sporosarcina pasteurii]
MRTYIKGVGGVNTEMFRKEVEMTYEKVKSLAGWTVDKDVVLTITSYYVTSEREFNAESLNRAMDAIKEKTGWFSPLRGNLLPMIAAFIDRPDVVIEEEVNQLFDKQRMLRSVGFRNTIHSYLAALLMTDDEDLYDNEARQAKALFVEMKKRHYFLTSDDDYAYAVLLGNRGFNPVEHAKAMRLYYDTLRKQGFRGGNELQWMSQVLTYIEASFQEANVLRAHEITNFLKEKAKVRQVHYPMIGFLTVFGIQNTELKKILDLTQSLEETKILKWKRDMALSIAIGYVLNEIIENQTTLSVSLATSTELIIQAQQAIMAATIAAMASSAATNSSNS